MDHKQNVNYNKNNQIMKTVEDDQVFYNSKQFSEGGQTITTHTNTFAINPSIKNLNGFYDY